MGLTPLGAKVAQLGDKERLPYGKKLVQGEDVGKYVKGVCYEAAAFTRFMLGADIKPKDIVDIDHTNWTTVLKFASGTQWDGKAAIPPGKAVGFFRTVDKKWFHAGISTGGSKMRAVNGGKLGNGWDVVDLKQVLKNPDAKKQFEWDNTKIEVYVSRV